MSDHEQIAFLQVDDPATFEAFERAIGLLAAAVRVTHTHGPAIGADQMPATRQAAIMAAAMQYSDRVLSAAGGVHPEAHLLAATAVLARLLGAMDPSLRILACHEMFNRALYTAAVSDQCDPVTGKPKGPAL